MRDVRRIGLCAASLVVVSSCGESPFGEENAFESRFEFVITNGSDEVIYRVLGPAGPPEPVVGEAGPILPGESTRIGAGGVSTPSDPPGGCLDTDQLWLIRSRSDTKLPLVDLADHQDDIEILEFFAPTTCTEQEEFEYTWND